MVVVATAEGADVRMGTLSEWIGFLSVLAVALLAPLPFLSLGQLLTSRAVWQGRRLPQPVLHGALRAHRRFLIGAWLALAVPLMVLRVWPLWGQSAAVLPLVLAAVDPLAMLAAWLVGALLLAAAQQGTLSWPWGLASMAWLLGLARWTDWGASGMGFERGADLGAGANAALASTLGSVPWFRAASTATALAAAVAVVLLWLISLRQVHRVLAQDVVGVPPRRSWLARLQGPYMRLAERWRLPQSLVQVAGLYWPLSIVTVLLGQFNAVQPGPQDWIPAWGTSVTPWHALRLLVMVSIAMPQIEQVRLSARVMLAPGAGRVRRWLGLRLIVTTWLSFTLRLLLWLALLWVAAAVWVPTKAPALAGLPPLALSYGPSFVLDVLLATSAAAAIQGSLMLRDRPQLDGFGLLVIGLAVSAVFVLTFIYWPPLTLQAFGGPALWHREGGHFLGQLALAALFALLAQRTWRRVDYARLVDPWVGRRKPSIAD